MKHILRISSVIFVGYFFFCDLPFSLANGNTTITANYYTDAKALIDQVNSRRARQIVSELYSQPKAWDSLLRNIATGADSWLRVAVALHPGSDAGASEMLTLSVGEALENAPENVFRIAIDEFRLDSICTAPDVDDVRYNSFELAMNGIKKRQNRIAAISDPTLKNKSKKCIQFLEESKKGVAKFYGISNQPR